MQGPIETLAAPFAEKKCNKFSAFFKSHARHPAAPMMGRMLTSFTECLCCWRGSRQYADLDDNDQNWAQPLNLFQPRPPATLDDLLEKTSRAREAVWQQLGALEPMFLSHLVNPALSTGQPKWPSKRQAFRLVRRQNGNVILASDGLSDPFDDVTLGSPAQAQASSHWPCCWAPTPGLL